jgi:gliding motility-associated-like protein
LFVRTDTNRVHATAQAVPTFGCKPLNVQFLAFNNNATSLVWNFGDKNNSTSNLVNPNFIYTDTGFFKITLIATDTNTCNRVDTSSIVVHSIFDYPISRFKVSDSLACSKLNVSLTNLSQNAVRYLWTFGDNSTSTLFQPPPHYFDTTFFNSNLSLFRIQLVAYDSTKCIYSDTDYHDIKIFKMPNADFKINPSVLLKPDSLFSFFNKSYNADNYQWIIDDNIVSNATDFYQSWYSLGSHKVCLISNSELGCSDTICKSVEIDVDISIGVPNAFSPDGDGQNDYFKVYGYGIDKLDFRVFNRWGQLVFQTDDRHIGWDGTFNGKQQEMEVYAWTVNVTFLTGEKRKLKGNVTLVR